MGPTHTDSGVRRGVLGATAMIVAAVAVAAPAGAVPGGVPPVSPQAAAAGFVDVRTVVPDAVIDLRYATPHNFVGVPLYPADARCLVHESMAPGLAKAADELRAQGDVLVFWDCYRPHDVQVRMFDAVPNPAWVAKPGPYARSHEAGRSVDVTIAERGQLVDMGTDFDDFSARATAYATDGVSAAAQANRARLRAAMGAGGQERSDPGNGSGGLAVYSGEWWHFDGPGAGVQRPILDVPID
ncbi:M15 family metallopeptidase [Mycobacterium sp. RTGN5]|uniref:M15 family metallopeptidase n=1 Tax=Mycobacterium sp. RTGN5 TaxID=3016522 RepID=UPI0039B36D31